jgi:hypothetical protein
VFARLLEQNGGSFAFVAEGMRTRMAYAEHQYRFRARDPWRPDAALPSFERSARLHRERVSLSSERAKSCALPTLCPKRCCAVPEAGPR